MIVSATFSATSAEIFCEVSTSYLGSLMSRLRQSGGTLQSLPAGSRQETISGSPGRSLISTWTAFPPALWHSLHGILISDRSHSVGRLRVSLKVASCHIVSIDSRRGSVIGWNIGSHLRGNRQT